MFPSADRSRKRRSRDRMFGITTFGDPGCPGDFDGPFRENIKVFLDECAEPELYHIEGMPAWTITLQESDNHGDRCTLLIVEEASMHALHPHCDHCRCIGERLFPKRVMHARGVFLSLRQIVLKSFDGSTKGRASIRWILLFKLTLY